VGELFNVSEQLQHKVIFIYFMSNVGGGGKSCCRRRLLFRLSL